MAEDKSARPPSGVSVVNHDVELADDMGTLPVVWWVPTTVPVVGVAWLQHGYARKPHYLTSLAGALAATGLMVAMPTVESFRRAHSINDTVFLDAIGTALCTVADDAVPSVARAAGIDLDGAVGTRLVLVAHSAGCAVVARAAKRALADGTVLRGIVLLDATENLAKSFASSLDGLGDAPIRGVFAQPSWCNRKGQGAKALTAARSGYVGIRLTSGTHCDAEGHDTDRVCRAMCGKPDPANVDVLYEATAAWTRNLALGEPTTEWEPNGERLDEESRIGRVVALYGTAAS